MLKPTSAFHVYVPVGVTANGRELFRIGIKAVMQKFAFAERKHQWKDAFLTADKEIIQKDLYAHLEKGDPRDVIIYCLILLYHGWSTKD